MKTDSDIKQDVEAELKWTPEIDATDIAVKVVQRIVTLTGFVHSYPEKSKAEAAVKRVAGVTGVANDIEVRLPARNTAPDPEIAREISAALQRALPATWENIRALVHQGHVTLEGSVEWHYQREIADDAARAVRGVISLGNSIRIQPQAKSPVRPAEIKHKIEAAFQRQARIDARHVSVQASGAEVILRGEVGSWAERDQAERTAWSAPGVTQVRNEIAVRV